MHQWVLLITPPFFFLVTVFPKMGWTKGTWTCSTCFETGCKPVLIYLVQRNFTWSVGGGDVHCNAPPPFCSRLYVSYAKLSRCSFLLHFKNFCLHTHTSIFFFSCVFVFPTPLARKPNFIFQRQVGVESSTQST